MMDFVFVMSPFAFFRLDALPAMVAICHGNVRWLKLGLYRFIRNTLLYNVKCRHMSSVESLNFLMLHSSGQFGRPVCRSFISHHLKSNVIIWPIFHLFWARILLLQPNGSSTNTTTIAANCVYQISSSLESAHVSLHILPFEFNRHQIGWRQVELRANVIKVKAAFRLLLVLCVRMVEAPTRLGGGVGQMVEIVFFLKRYDQTIKVH